MSKTYLDKTILDYFKSEDQAIFKQIQKVDFKKWLLRKKNNKQEYFIALIRQIISQQLSGKAANTIQRRFEAMFKNNEITPVELLKFEDQKLRNAGMSWAKASYVKNIATAILGEEICWDDFHELSDEDVIAELTKIKGIGRWTTEMFLMFTLGRKDVFSHGDIGLRRGLEKLYNLDNPSKKQIESIVSKWIPYRTFGSIALWQSLEK